MSAAPLKIIIVDDEPPIRKLLRMGLTTTPIRLVTEGFVAQDAGQFAGQI